MYRNSYRNEVGLDPLAKNKLEHFILLSGRKKKDIAELKGITPATLSRQIAGKHELSFKDAEEYGVILGCSPTAIMGIDPVKIVGVVGSEASVRLFDSTQKDMLVTPPTNLGPHIHVLKIEHVSGEDHLEGSIMIYNSHFMQQMGIDAACHKRLCIVKYLGVDNLGKTSIATVYPSPNNKYMLVRWDDSRAIIQDAEIIWACPVMACYYQPTLFGWQFND